MILSRRALLAGGLTACGLASSRVYARATEQWSATPFTLGVASGDPTPTSVVLWTRLAPDPVNGGGMAPRPVVVDWELGTNDRLTGVVRRGRTEARPEWGHAVHVTVNGLAPDRWYWYRFLVSGIASPIGRTRTLPAAGAAVDRLRFAFASCQHYENGFFTVYRHMAAEDLDLVLHLGDYIYEGAGRANQIRTHAGPELETLTDYRNRYAQYKLDPDLQAAHAAFPWIVTPDDHEVDNNYAGDLSEEAAVPRDAFLRRRTAAYRAYYEHMPLGIASVPKGASMAIYRQMAYGALASFFVLDTRQFRTDQPCGDGSKAPCPGVADPAATLLGDVQERWLTSGLAQSGSRWNVLPQQVMMAKVDLTAGADERYSMDQWAAYDAARTRLLKFFADRRPSNPVVLTGDIHSNWVNDLKVDFRDPASPTVATELVGTSISSGGNGSDLPPAGAALLAENPFIKFHNRQRGYVSCDVSPTGMRADYQVVEYVTRPGAPKSTRASFVIENGRPGAARA